MTEEENKFIDEEIRYKEFVLYFRELDRFYIPYGMSELIRVAEELGLQIPSREEVGLRIYRKTDK